MEKKKKKKKKKREIKYGIPRLRDVYRNGFIVPSMLCFLNETCC